MADYNNEDGMVQRPEEHDTLFRLILDLCLLPFLLLACRVNLDAIVRGIARIGLFVVRPCFWTVIRLKLRPWKIRG